jgi:hypothetical protein
MELNYFIIEISSNSSENYLAAQSKVYTILEHSNNWLMRLYLTLGIEVCLHFLVLCSEWSGLSEEFCRVPEEVVVRNFIT